MSNQISKNIRWISVIFLITTLWLLWIIISNSQNQTLNSLLEFEGLLLFFSILLLLIFNSFKKVKFNQYNLIIIYRQTEEVIPLDNIIKIKMTMHSVGHSMNKFWKISYLDNKGRHNSVRFLPRYSNFNLFLRKVKEINNKAVIQQYTHSFDLDQ